jgi:hypothetical protein
MDIGNWPGQENEYHVGELGATGKTYSIQYRIYYLKTKSKYLYYIPHNSKTMSIDAIYQTAFFGSPFEDQNIYLEFVKKTMADQIKFAVKQSPDIDRVKRIAKFFDTKETIKEIYGPTESVIKSSLVASPVVKVTI